MKNFHSWMIKTLVMPNCQVSECFFVCLQILSFKRWSFAKAQLPLCVRFSRDRNSEKIERKYEPHNPDQSVFCHICSFWFDIFCPDLFFMEILWSLPRNQYWEEIIWWKNILVEALYCAWNCHVHFILLAQQTLS